MTGRRLYVLHPSHLTGMLNTHVMNIVLQRFCAGALAQRLAVEVPRP